MIENYSQYVVTRDAVKKFEEALRSIDDKESDDAHPLILKAQRDGLISMITEMRADMKTFETTEIDSKFHRGEDVEGILFGRSYKNTANYGRLMEPSPFLMVVREHGILINGDYGTNPSREEMREMLDAMRALVKDWDKRYGGEQ